MLAGFLAIGIIVVLLLCAKLEEEGMRRAKEITTT
jgi:hypothetical protein